MTATTERAREKRLRRTADRQGLTLRKRRGTGAFWIVDPYTNSITAGDPTYGGMDLDQVEAYLTTD